MPVRDFARCLSAFGDAGLTRNASARTSLAAAVLRELSQCLGGDRGTPVVRAGSAGDFVGPDDFAVGEVHVFQVSEVRHVRVLAVRHTRLHVNDHGIFQLDGEVVLLSTGGGSAVPLQTALGQTLTGGQGVEDQRRGFVEDFGDHQRLVYALASRLTGLRITRDDDLVVEGLNQDLVFMTFLEDVTDGIFGEGASGDQALFGAFEGQIRGCWHECFPCLGSWICSDPGTPPVATSMPIK